MWIPLSDLKVRFRSDWVKENDKIVNGMPEFS